MKKNKLFALALTVAVVGTMSVRALAEDDLAQGTVGAYSPNTNESLNQDNDVITKTKAINKYDNDVITKTKTTAINKTDDSYNTKTTAINKYDNDVINKTETKTKIDDSYNTKTTAINKTDDSYNTKTKVKNEDSYNQISTTGSQSPAMSNSEIKNSDFEDVDQTATGQFSLNVNDDSDVKENNFVNQYTTGGQSPSMVDSKIDDSVFAGQSVDLSKNSHNVYTQNGQLNAANSDVWVDNLAGDNSTILDGDVSLGGGRGYPTLGVASELNGPGAFGLGGETNINTGIIQDAIMGDKSAMMNGAGIGINGIVGDAGKGGGGANLNSAQNTNINNQLGGN